MNAERWHPTDGQALAWFQSRWCNKCKRELGSPRGCASLFKFAVHAKASPNWIRDEDGPRCKAFAAHVPAKAEPRIEDAPGQGMLF